MVGAMVATTLVVTLIGADPGSISAWLALLAALLLAIPVCMALGWVAERYAYRPLRRAPRLAALITAIGVSIIIQNIARSEEHTSELQSLLRISYAVFCLK